LQKQDVLQDAVIWTLIEERIECAFISKATSASRNLRILTE